ncbi:hypothetical protein GCM10027444_24780 [Actinopolyspora lacussalsi]
MFTSVTASLSESTRIDRVADDPELVHRREMPGAMVHPRVDEFVWRPVCHTVGEKNVVKLRDHAVWWQTPKGETNPQQRL